MQGVKDLLASDGREYTLTSHCTTDTHMDFMLTPPRRAKQQAALVVIRGTLDDASAEQPVHNFLVESILPLHDDDANVAKASLLKLISLMALAEERSARILVGRSTPAQPKLPNAVPSHVIQRGTKSQHIPILRKSTKLHCSSVVQPAKTFSAWRCLRLSFTPFKTSLQC